MNDLSPKQRLLAVLDGRAVDRSPVVCPGGMMNAAVVDVMRSSGVALPSAYDDSDQLARLTREVSSQTGFENLALPFCMTLEAEFLGSEIDPGTTQCEAKVAKEAFLSVDAASIRRLDRLPAASRIERVVEAVGKLASVGSDRPVIASLTGPISTAASVVDPVTFLKQMRKNRQGTHRTVSEITQVLISLARHFVDAGADVIAISDPTATGEILGPRAFEEFALKYLVELVHAIHAFGRPAIVHICGDITAVESQVVRIGADAVSTDSLVNLIRLKQNHSDLVVMGNLSTYLLQFGTPAQVQARATRLVEDGVDIIAPACGLSTSTAIENIQAMTGAVKHTKPCPS